MVYNLSFTGEEVKEKLTPKRVYAYISTPLPTTMVKADTWYKFNSVFTNKILDGFSLGSNGITLTADDDYLEIEWQTSGVSTTTSNVEIAITKDATFDSGDGELLTGDVIEGSIGGTQADIIGQTNGYISPHSLTQDDILTGELSTLVIKSTVAGTVFTPTEGAASLHKSF